MSALRWAESILLQLPMRLGLGGIFIFAAVNKIGNPQAFAFAIKGFKMIDPQTHGNLIITAAYTIPWVEMIAGVLLILGLRARAAALTLGLVLIAFIGGLLHVINSGIHADCSCFGDQKLFCGSTVGWCQVTRNAIMLVPALYLVVRGGGILAIDRLAEPKPSTDQTLKGPTSLGVGVDEHAVRG